MINLNEVQADSSWAPMVPGTNVEVEVTEVSVDENGNLDFKLKGTSVSNPGTFNLRFWASTFDKTEERYSENKETNISQQIKQMVCAFLTNDEIAAIKYSESFPVYAKAIAAAFTPEKINGVICEMAIIYRAGSDEKLDVPGRGVIISSPLKAQKLRSEEELEKGVRQDGLPWNRLKPMAEYGAEASDESPDGEAAPDAGEDLPF